MERQTGGLATRRNIAAVPPDFRRSKAFGTHSASILGALCLAAMFEYRLAQATTTSNTFTVQAVISSSCNVSATTLNFGTYDPTSATALNGTSTVSIFCTSGTPYAAALNVGSGGGSFTARTVANGGNTLNYNLFRDAARSQVWGDASGSTFTVSGTGSGLLTANNLTVYGEIATAQDKPPGTYTSTVTVTVSY
jgi:spore coat protein U-like protein